MTARLGALCDHCINAGFFERYRFIDGRRGTDQKHAASLDGFDCGCGQNSEGEAENRRAAIQRRSELLAERVGGESGRLRRRQLELRVEGRDAFQSPARIFRRVGHGLRREEADSERPGGARAHRPCRLENLLRRQIGPADEPQAAGFTDGGDQLRRVPAARERRLDDRMDHFQTPHQLVFQWHGHLRASLVVSG